MTQVVPSAQPRNLPAARYTLGAPAGNRRPVTMWVDGTPVYGTLYEPTAAAARGQAVGVLILEQVSWHRMHHRLARHLAAAGYYALTFDFRSRGESGVSDEWEMWQRHWVPASMVADTLQAMATFRALVPLQRLIGYGYCQAGHVAARAAVLGGMDALIFAGPVTIDDYFRHNYKGVLSGLPNLWASDDLNLFEPLAEFSGPVLFIHGDRDLFLAASPLEREIERAEAWQQAAPGRSFELCTIQGADHTFSSWPHESVVIEHTLAFLERHFGPGYPRSWQGPPPTPEVQERPRQDDPAAWVPLLATGYRLLRDGDAFRLTLPDGRQFALTPPLAALVRLLDGYHPLATIAPRLAAQLGRPVSVEQVARLLEDKLAPLGVVTPDSRGEGGEAEAGMTDILIRVYEPHDRFRQLLDNLTRVTRSPYNVIAVVGKRHAVLNQNRALERVRTRYAVFLDDDVLLTPGWLERLRETMDRTGAGAVSGRQLRMNGEPLASAAAVAPGQIVEIAFGGACFMFRTDLGIRFDERFVRSQWDDFDFLFQIYERGYKGYIDGRVDFYHHADPKYVTDQNYDYFVRKWTEKGLYRGLMFCRYPGGQRGYLPNFGD